MNSSTISSASATAVNGIIDHADPRVKPRSAAAAFSNLICSPHKLDYHSQPAYSITRAVYSGLWSTGPHSLPTEIIRMIFQFVFESCVGSEDSVNDDNPTSWLDENPLSPSLFPYSLACVCLRWFRILRTIPIYWTRLVITLDGLATSLNAARTTLGWAGNHPLKIVVTRHSGAFESRSSEHTGVSYVMQFLRPRIDRIWSLSFDVEHSSSIPSLWREKGRARYLRVLALTSRSNAGGISQLPSLIFAGSNHEYEGKLKIPHLQQVTFDGHFLKNPLLAHPRLGDWFRHITSLTICGDAASSGSAISLYRFLLMINNMQFIRELTMKDIHFDDNAPFLDLYALRPVVLYLCRITGGTALRGFLTHVRMGASAREDITIIDCTIQGFREPDIDSNPQFSSTSLTLTSMDPSATIEDLVSQWNGERLSVISCPGMSRSFLERLHGEAAPVCLSHLRIIDCNNFNAGDVISLVQSRETQATLVSLMGVPEDDSFAELVELRVQGRGPPISVKRATWLAEHVETFSWDTVAKDGSRYVWDGSARKLTMFPASGSSEGQAGEPTLYDNLSYSDTVGDSRRTRSKFMRTTALLNCSPCGTMADLRYHMADAGSLGGAPEAVDERLEMGCVSWMSLSGPFGEHGRIAGPVPT